MRVALIRLSALGDIVHAWPLAAALRRGIPGLHLTWVVEEAYRDLVCRHPAVDETVTVATRRWRRAPLAATTRSEVQQTRRRLVGLRPEVALDPQGLVKSALVTRATGAPRRVGLARPWRRELLAGLAYTERWPGASGAAHVVATNLSLLRAVGLEPPAALPPPDGRWLLEPPPPAAPSARSWPSPYAVLLVGAGQTAKALPVPTLALVGAGLERLGLATVVAWGPGELGAAAAVVGAAPTLHLAPPTDLRQLAALLAAASVVVGADTGPLHLAASLGVPSVGVFVCTSHLRNGPVGERVAVVSAVAEPAAAHGSARARAARPVTAEEVVTAARELLER